MNIKELDFSYNSNGQIAEYRGFKIKAEYSQFADNPFDYCDLYPPVAYKSHDEDGYRTAISDNYQDNNLDAVQYIKYFSTNDKCEYKSVFLENIEKIAELFDVELDEFDSEDEKIEAVDEAINDCDYLRIMYELAQIYNIPSLYGDMGIDRTLYILSIITPDFAEKTGIDKGQYDNVLNDACSIWASYCDGYVYEFSIEDNKGHTIDVDYYAQYYNDDFNNNGLSTQAIEEIDAYIKHNEKVKYSADKDQIVNIAKYIAKVEV